jgi:hypothetical protein
MEKMSKVSGLLKKKVMKKKKDKLFSQDKDETVEGGVNTNSPTGWFNQSKSSLSAPLSMRGVTTNFKNLSKLTKKK